MRNLKLGLMSGNDVHQLLLKYEPSQPDGGAVSKDFWEGQNLVGTFTTGMGICLPKHVELKL